MFTTERLLNISPPFTTGKRLRLKGVSMHIAATGFNPFHLQLKDLSGLLCMPKIPSSVPSISR